MRVREPKISEEQARKYLEHFYKNIDQVKGRLAYYQKEKIRSMSRMREPFTDRQIFAVEDLVEQLKHQIPLSN